MFRKLSGFVNDIVFPKLTSIDSFALLSILLISAFDNKENIFNTIMSFIETSTNPGTIYFVLAVFMLFLVLLPAYAVLNSVFVTKKTGELIKNLVIIYFYLYSLIFFSVSAVQMFIFDYASIVNINSLFILILFIRSIAYLTIIFYIIDIGRNEFNLEERFVWRRMKYLELLAIFILSLVVYLFLKNYYTVATSVALSYFYITTAFSLKENLFRPE